MGRFKLQHNLPKCTYNVLKKKILYHLFNFVSITRNRPIPTKLVYVKDI